MTTDCSVLVFGLTADNRKFVESRDSEPGGVGLLPNKLQIVEKVAIFGEIDICASGTNPEAALLWANSIRGLLALTLGDRAIGRLKNRETRTLREGKLEIEMFIVEAQAHDPMIRPIETISFTDIKTFYESLLLLEDHLRIPKQKRQAILSALSSYHRALSSISRHEQFISFFSGAELITQAYRIPPAENDPKVRVATDEEFLQFLRDLQPKYADINLQKVLLGALHRQSASEIFHGYAREHSLETLLPTYERVKPLRDRIAHGSLTDVEVSDIEDARKLLTTLLRRELSLPSTMNWEHQLRFDFINVVGHQDRSELIKSVSSTTVSIQH